MDSLLKSYLKRHFNSIPSHYISADSNRITLFYFLICSSELNHQIIKDFDLTSYLIKTGFTGHLFINKSHITMTFSALLLSCKLENKQNILDNLTNLQHKNGSFCPFVGSTEYDIRFTYCAIAICYILNDFTTININLAVDFIINCQTYEGGFGKGRLMEAHGGWLLV